MNSNFILLVSPYNWGSAHPVNTQISSLADELRRLNADDKSVPFPVVVAPYSESNARRATRKALREFSISNPQELFALGSDGRGGAHDSWPLVALPVPTGPASVSLRAAVRTLLASDLFSIVHIFDPLANELTKTALKNSQNLTVASVYTNGAVAQIGSTKERLLERVDQWIIADEHLDSKTEIYLRLTDRNGSNEQVTQIPAVLSAEARSHRHLETYASLRKRVQKHPEKKIDAPERNCVIDLHMHTSHSWDCATEPRVLLETARSVGLTAVAITDHNEISGAKACAELAEEYGIQVIVGEEIKTAEGEVIGLFLEEKIEPGLGWHETIALIKEQDALVYVPHPFDRLHTIPDATLLRGSLDDIDAFETYNARLPFDQYNREAELFARKYNLIEGAGSDAHVAQGLGTAAVHMPSWSDKESFLTALAQGEILKRPKSLLYLQGLKWVNDLTGRSRRSPDRLSTK